jgi:hypothetical protein
VFQAIKWAGVAYLVLLGAQAIRSAIRGQYPPLDGDEASGAKAALVGWRQGFVSNITNPQGPRLLPGRSAAVPRARRGPWLAAGVRLESRRLVAGLPARPHRVPARRPPAAGALPGPPRPGRHHRHGAPGLQRPPGRRAPLNNCSLPARIVDPRSTPTHVIFRISII